MKDNDKVWQALRPALLLVTKVLESRHPHFEALLDPFNRTVDQRQVHPRSSWAARNPKVSTFSHKPLHDDDVVAEAKVLSDLGIDGKALTEKVLGSCMMLGLMSAHIDNGSAADSPSYGLTNLIGVDADGGMTEHTVISLNVAADYLWPLLVDGYSQSEKLAASFIVASTILHELAVRHSTRVLGAGFRPSSAPFSFRS